MTITASAILDGPYLAGVRVLVTLDRDGRITSCNAIRCIWSDTPRFDSWFRGQYNPAVLVDGGEEYRAWLESISRDGDDVVHPIAA